MKKEKIRSLDRELKRWLDKFEPKKNAKEKYQNQIWQIKRINPNVIRRRRIA